MVALVPDGAAWRPVGGGRALRFCENAELHACNWLLEAGCEDRFCLACRPNRTVPNLNDPERMDQWRTLERAKHRLMHTLLRLGLPIIDRYDDPEGGLAFDFLADAGDGGRVMTGHDQGLITIALREADDVERERMRVSLSEYYRTVLGHFRHEIGHYYWNVLVRDEGRLEECRAVFGDDREDYGGALKRYYENGPPSDWRERFVSAYATMHAWEDFAETWAHYLHMIDALETAGSYGLETAPHVPKAELLTTRVDFDPFREEDFGRLSGAWLPLTYLLNSMNRSMGLPDSYPFVLTPGILQKMAFVHRLVRGVSQGVERRTETGQ